MRRFGVVERRRLLCERQLLGSTARSDRSIVDVANALSLLHSTDPSTPYLSIHARTDAAIADVDSAFYDERTLIRHTTIRRTVFAMPMDAAKLAHGAVNLALVSKLRAQLTTWIEASADVDEPADAFLAHTEQQVIEELRSSEPSSGAALANAVPALRTRVEPMPGASYSKPIRITSKVIEILAASGELARARPTGADFTSGAWTWAPFTDWSSSTLADSPASTAALAGLLTRYLSTFGPATVTDMTWWTGLTKTKVRAALAEIGAVEVEMAAGDGTVGEAGFVLAGDGFAELDADPPDEPIVALLPGLDSTTMGWKQRQWYVDDSVERGWFDRNGNAGPTVWCDGAVVGAWSQRPDGSIVHDVTVELGAAARAQVEAECRRLEVWLGDVRVKWRFPTPATKRLIA